MEEDVGVMAVRAYAPQSSHSYRRLQIPSWLHSLGEQFHVRNFTLVEGKARDRSRAPSAGQDRGRRIAARLRILCRSAPAPGLAARLQGEGGPRRLGIFAP